MSAADLANAIAKAEAAGDRTGEWCWQSLRPVISPSGQLTGAASAVEGARLVAIDAAGPCSGILGPVFSLIP
jgi:hypothetical protein